jgi:hypothetical protein
VAEIKGTVLLDTLKAIKARGGEAAMARILASLDEASRKVFDSPIQASSWYPLDAFTEFLEADIRETANGDREVLIRRSEKVIESQLRGIYKIFVAFGSPRFVITRISAVHATYFKGIQIIPEIDSQSATIRYAGFGKQHEIMECPVIGFFRKALEISGASRVKMEFTIPISKGEAYSELTITWA